MLRRSGCPFGAEDATEAEVVRRASMWAPDFANEIATDGERALRTIWSIALKTNVEWKGYSDHFSAFGRWFPDHRQLCPK